MKSNRNPKITLEWNTEGRRRKKKPREQWMDGIRKVQERSDIRRCKGHIFVAEQHFFGVKDTYCTV